MKVRALDSFEHNGPRYEGAIFEVSQQHANLLASKHLVEVVDDSAPLLKEAGEAQPSSASPAGQASPEPIANSQEPGDLEPEVPAPKGRKTWKKGSRRAG